MEDKEEEEEGKGNAIHQISNDKKWQKGSIGEFIIDKDFVKWENNKEERKNEQKHEEEKEEEEEGRKDTGKETEEPGLEAKTNKKSNLKFLVICVFIIVIGFSMLGIIIYLVQKGRQEV